MRSLPVVALVLTVLVLSAVSPAAAQSISDTFCVQVSRTVQAENLNRLVAQRRVTVRVVDSSECALGTTDFLTFATHNGIVTTSYTGFFDDVVAGSDTFDLETMARGLRGIRAIANEELRWLDSHLPDACYAGLHSEWMAVNQDYAEAAESALRGVETFDADLIEGAADDMMAASERVSDLGAELTDYADACDG